MNMKNYVKKEFLKAEHVADAENKTLVLKNAGKEEEGKFGKQAIFEVRFEGKNYHWSPNGQSVENLIKAYGPDSEDWIGKTVKLKPVETKSGNMTIMGHGVVPEEEDISS